MALRTAPRPAAAANTRTQTQTDSGVSEDDSRTVHVGTLRLRGQPRSRPSVRWADDVVDNSNMNKKKSKVCCIYHKPRAVDESSSESSDSSSSESDSDSEPDNSTARMGGRGAAKRESRHHQRHDCDGHGHGYDSSASDDAGSPPAHASHGARDARGLRRRSPNAYEKMKTSKRGGSSTMTVPQQEK